MASLWYLLCVVCVGLTYLGCCLSCPHCAGRGLATDVARKPVMASYDIVIVGAGPMGLSVACALAKTGWSVCVLEAGSAPQAVAGRWRRDTRAPSGAGL